MSRQPLVCDTTVPLYLGRIGQIDLLPAIFASVYVPEQICLELDMGRVLRPDTIDPRSLAWVEIVIAAVRPLVDDVTAQGFHLSPELHRDVLELAGETP